MLEDEVEAAKGGDERAGDAVHHHHGEEKHHPGILLTKPELVGNGTPGEGGWGWRRRSS